MKDSFFLKKARSLNYFLKETHHACIFLSFYTKLKIFYILAWHECFLNAVLEERWNKQHLHMIYIKMRDYTRYLRVRSWFLYVTGLSWPSLLWRFQKCWCVYYSPKHGETKPQVTLWKLFHVLIFGYSLSGFHFLWLGLCFEWLQRDLSP